MATEQCSRPICNAITALIGHGPVTLEEQGNQVVVKWDDAKSGKLKQGRGESLYDALADLLTEKE